MAVREVVVVSIITKGQSSVADVMDGIGEHLAAAGDFIALIEDFSSTMARSMIAKMAHRSQVKTKMIAKAYVPACTTIVSDVAVVDYARIGEFVVEPTKPNVIVVDSSQLELHILR